MDWIRIFSVQIKSWASYKKEKVTMDEKSQGLKKSLSYEKSK